LARERKIEKLMAMVLLAGFIGKDRKLMPKKTEMNLKH
jgi:hypothetical protein